jgi:asparagine synthase (glutamine-hydrolysing)
MCGIAGYFGAHNDPAPGVLDGMVDALRHRGPDARGTLRRAGVGLGHARLSIVDLEGGRQPISNEDWSVWVALNGEVFNHVELRRDLEARGHVFRTRSDTEVIVHAYEEQGPRCLESLNGDFAFALWDRRQSRLLLARDRMGVRPLYYAQRAGTLVFASEIKALLRFPGIEARLDPLALEQCFTFWFPLAPRTPFAGVRELPPGHLLIAERGRISVQRYWALDYPAANEAAEPRDEAQVAEELRALLAEATRIRMRADVPVGAYLSGGLDSSATAALMDRLPGQGLKTFSVGFDSEEFDEGEFQSTMVRALGTEHSSVRCSVVDIARHFPEVVRHAEHPMLRTAPAPLFMLSRLVREQGIKVVMTGEGADEILGGYDIFKEAKVRRFWARQPQSAWRPLLFARLYPYLTGMHRQPRAFLQAFFANGLERTGDPLFSHLPRFAVAQRGRRFFSSDLRAQVGGYDALEELRQQLPKAFTGWHPLSQAQYLETAYLMPGYILSSQGDRVAMAHGVEGRFPFLDQRVVEFAAQIPPRMKLRGLREKHILRRAVGDCLPAPISERPKQPYRAPGAECFFGPRAPEYARELLSRRSIARAGYFDPEAVERLASKCRAGAPLTSGDDMALVGILSTQLLHYHFIEHAAVSSAAAC